MELNYILISVISLLFLLQIASSSYLTSSNHLTTSNYLTSSDRLTSDDDTTSNDVWYADDPPEDADIESDDIASDDITDKLTGKEKNTHSQEGDMHVTKLEELAEKGRIHLDEELEDLDKWPSTTIPYVFAKNFSKFFFRIYQLRARIERMDNFFIE